VDYLSDLCSASPECLALLDWLERKFRVKQQNRAIAVEIIERQAVKEITNKTQIVLAPAARLQEFQPEHIML
jgi:hypothetical protein